MVDNNPITSPTPSKWYPWNSLTVDNRRRPVAWRWIRARQLVAAGKENGGRFEDPTVNQACALLRVQSDDMGLITLGEQAARRAQPGSFTDEDGVSDDEKALSALPDLYKAFEIYTQDPNTRWQLEAILISGVDTPYISEQFALNEETVEAYEKIFFDIRDRLKARAFITGTVLDTAIRHDHAADDPDKWWKALGYQGYRLGIGSDLLEAWWDYDVLPDSVRAWLENTIDSNVTKQAAAFTATSRVNPEIASYFTQNYWSSRRMKLDQNKLEQEKGGSGSDAASKQNLLESMQMTVGDITNKNHNRRVEPRANEQLQAELEQLGIEVGEANDAPRKNNEDKDSD